MLYCCHWSAGKRKSKGKSKASAKDAAAAAEKRSSKVAAVASTKARGKPKKLGVTDHILNALPPQLSRWLRKHRKLITWGIIAFTVLAFCFMLWWNGGATRRQEQEMEAALRAMRAQQQQQQQQHMQEQARRMHGQHRPTLRDLQAAGQQ
jgi:hypothetical protein